jgi:bacillolysin
MFSPVYRYTDTTNGLIYAYQSGALNEAYSDMHGESIDILNADTPDTVTLRTEYPLTCTVYLDSDLNVPAGTDNTKRWELGEEVDTDATSTDESLRDMYYPECFINPGSVFSDAFVCTTSDEGGVHTNSGVPNRLYAVIVDGGEYEDPSNPSQRISVTGLGLTKATNLIWRAQLELTPSSQFSDWGTALQEACTASIDSDIYVPNLLSGSSTPAVSSSSITAADCTNLNNAIIGSGIMDDSDWCPNMECSSSTACTFSTCPANTLSAKYEVNITTCACSLLGT